MDLFLLWTTTPSCTHALWKKAVSELVDTSAKANSLNRKSPVKRLSRLQRSHQLRTARIRAKRKKRRWKRRLNDDLSYASDQPTRAETRPPRLNPMSLYSISAYRHGRISRYLARQRKVMPSIFCLTENHDEVAKFLLELRHDQTIGGERIQRLRMSGRLRRGRIYDSFIDFGTMDRITPAAALVLASEYDRANSLYDYEEEIRAINLETWKPEVRSTLQDVGFLPLLGVDPPRDHMVSHEGVYTVPFMSGSKVDGAVIDDLILTLARFAEGRGVGDSETLLGRSRVYDGLGEAIQNVEDHAYPDNAVYANPVVKRWWMTGAVEPTKKRFNLVIYDQGISIPTSLPRWSRYDEFKATFLNAIGREYNTDDLERDGETIAQAVALGQSSTGEPWHGKGLPLMREIVENASDGSLRILSRCGEYVYQLGQKPSCRSFAVPLSGTLVEWNLYL